MKYKIHALIHTVIFSQPRETNVNYKYRIMCQTAPSFQISPPKYLPNNAFK